MAVDLRYTREVTKNDFVKDLKSKDKINCDLRDQINRLQETIKQLGGNNLDALKDKDVLMEHVESLRLNLDNANRTIVELTDTKMHLEGEVSQLRSNLELTASSKDKIILKLRQEIQLLQQNLSRFSRQ